MEDKVTLYIATHNITGMKYFGKTTKWFTEDDLQKNYKGSGKYWSRHKKKHGDNEVTMEIYKICSLNESDEDYVKPIALQFSEENNIVKSEDWANLEFENGINGASPGRVVSVETKEKQKNSITGKTHSEESKLKMSESRQGEKHWNFGKTHSEETKEKIKTSTKESMQKYTGKNNPMNTHNIDFKGEKNPNYGNYWSDEQKLQMSIKKSNSITKISKRINIYNNNDEIIFECFGNFKKTCIENNLPFTSLRYSYMNNSKKIKTSNYFNWYAKIITTKEINEF